MATANPIRTPRCSAHSKQTGQSCKQPAIPGGTVCRYHGGAAPQVKQAATERLKLLVDPAITRLAELVAQKEFPSVAIAAVKDVLDRTQGKAAELLNLHLNLDAELLRQLELAKHRNAARAAQR